MVFDRSTGMVALNIAARTAEGLGECGMEAYLFAQPERRGSSSGGICVARCDMFARVSTVGLF
eukprot:COSAG02_NODE_1330_length_13218_cov_8.247504_6_plen_63_part_00